MRSSDGDSPTTDPWVPEGDSALVTAAMAAGPVMLARAGLADRAAHSRGVGAAAMLIAERVGLPLLRCQRAQATGYVHDVGYAHPDTGMHAVDGARWLSSAHPGLRALAPDVAWHSTAQWECQALGMTPPAWAKPGRLEHSILWVADFITSPSGYWHPISERLQGIRDRYDPDSAVIRALDASLPSLEAACERVGVRGPGDLLGW